MSIYGDSPLPPVMSRASASCETKERNGVLTLMTERKRRSSLRSENAIKVVPDTHLCVAPEVTLSHEI